MHDNRFLITGSISSLSANDVAAVAARALRSVTPRSKVRQYPLVDGGEGMIEHLVTATLGSFLEVEATSASDEQIIVPIGFAGENGAIGVIEMSSVAREPNTAALPKRSRTKGIRFTGTTFGVGELIRDVLDEGAHSILLGWDEPLARDAGFGMGQALGIRFNDAKGKELDFRTETPLQNVASIDFAGKPFELMAAKVYVGRAQSVSAKNSHAQVSVEDTLFENELDRIAEILRKDGGISLTMSQLISGGSYIDFGLAAFLNAEIRSGSILMLEASDLKGTLHREGGSAIFLVDTIEQLTNDKVQTGFIEALTATVETSIPIAVVSAEAIKPASKTKLQTKYPNIKSVRSLLDAELFAAPLPADAPVLEHRRRFTMQLEKFFQRFIVELNGQ